MATYYVRSTDGSDASDGSSWANAFATLKFAMEQATPPHTIYVSQAHAETQASAMTIAATGTIANPHIVICGDDSAEPPTATATTATVTTTGNSTISIGGSFYMYGIKFSCGSGSNGAVFTQSNSTNNWQQYEDCDFIMAGTATSSGAIRFGGTSAGTWGYTRWINCDVKFANAGHYIRPIGGTWDWDGGSLLTGGTTPTYLISPISSFFGLCKVQNVNLVEAAAGMHLFDCTTAGLEATILNCKLPASWTGKLINTLTAPALRVAMHNCDDGDQNYRSEYITRAGNVKTETTIYRTAGAVGGQYDGASALTAMSWDMTTVADAEYPAVELRSPEIVIYNDAVGSAKTATVEFLIDSATTLYTGDVWLEVSYLGTSGFPLGSTITTRLSLLTANTTECTAGTGVANWTGDGAGAKSYKLAATFTPQERGYIHARVCLAKASTTIYADPVITLS